MKKNKVLEGILIGASVAVAAIVITGIVQRKKYLSKDHTITLDKDEDTDDSSTCFVEEVNIEDDLNDK